MTADPSGAESDDLFGPGWLDRHIDETVAQIETWPPIFQALLAEVRRGERP